MNKISLGDSLRYEYIISKMIDCTEDINTEPLIIQISRFEFSVLYKKQMFYCGSNYFKSICIWFYFMENEKIIKKNQILFLNNV